MCFVSLFPLLLSFRCMYALAVFKNSHLHAQITPLPKSFGW